MKVVKFGIEELDALLGGGLLGGKSYLLESTRGSMPIFFVAAFLKQGCSDGELSMLGTFDRSYSDIIDESLAANFDSQKLLAEGALRVLDFPQSSILGAGISGTFTPSGVQIDIHQLSNLASVAWNETDQDDRRSGGLRTALYTLSSFIKHFGFDNSLQFIDAQVESSKKRNGVLIATVNQRMLKPRELSYLEETFDGLVELSVTEEELRFQRYIRVKDSPCPNFRQEKLPYELVRNLGVVSVASKLVRDFESLKASIRMTKPGVVDILGVRTYLNTTKAFSLIHRILFDELGYERGSQVLYMWGFESSSTVSAPLAGKMKIDLSAITDVVMDMFVKYINLRGWGRFESVDMDKDNQTMTVIYTDSPVASDLRDYGRPVDAYIAGAIAGAARMALGGNVVSKEKRCVAKGDMSCEFEVTRI